MDSRRALLVLALFAGLLQIGRPARAQEGSGFTPIPDDFAAGPVIEPLPPVNAPAAAPALPPGDAPAIPETVATPPAKEDADISTGIELDPEHEVIIEPPPKIWKGSIDLGLNGSEGNSQVFNFRFNVQITRETPDNKLKLVTNYVRTNSNGEETANRLFFDGRDELLFDESPWTLYVHETSEYDEFKDFGARVTADAGIGYQLIKNDLTSLVARTGPGFSYEVDGQDEVVPELAMSLALEHQLTKFQKLAISVDYFPAFENFGDYRCNTQASWQLVIDEENNLSLKLSAIDRYDSTPGDGLEPNELDYAATLLWSF